jgi:hypothetical protein
MKFLFDNKFAPLTFSWGFINAGLESTVRAFTFWQRCALRKVSSRRHGVKSLEESLTYLQPLDSEGQRSLFISTASDWVAYFENTDRGSQSEIVVGYLCEKMSCYGLTCTVIPQTLSKKDVGKKFGTWGAIDFHIYAPHKTGFLNLQREVSLRNDVSGWKFHTFGEPQEFEQLDVYRAKRNRDKFSTGLLEQYFKAFDIELFSEDFYRGECISARSYYWFLPKVKTISLLEAQKNLGIV